MEDWLIVRTDVPKTVSGDGTWFFVQFNAVCRRNLTQLFPIASRACVLASIDRLARLNRSLPRR